MNIDNDLFCAQGVPVYIQDAKELTSWIQRLDLKQAQKLWACNDGLAQLNFLRFQEMDLEKNLTPALLAYEGIQYQHMAPRVFTQKAWDYVQEHLRILSGFYGILKPLDGVTPYRLEMQAKVHIDGKKNLYEFWGKKLYQLVMDCDRTVINLASKEYSKCIEAYLQPGDRFISCVFGERQNGKVIQKGTQAKMARGDMVRFMAETQTVRPEQLKDFDHPHYSFCEELSSETTYVFLKQGR